MAASLCIEINRAQRGCRTNEQAVTLAAAKFDIRHHFACEDFPDQLAFGGVAMHAVTCRGPNVPVKIHPETVKKTGIALCENLTTGQGSVGRYIENTNMPWPVFHMGGAGVRDVEAGFIR